MMTAYIDNNIIVDIECGNYTLSDVIRNIDSSISTFMYSASHLHEANEITANTLTQLSNRLSTRFKTISAITNNNYLYLEIPSNLVYRLVEEPSTVFKTINDVPFTNNLIKDLINFVTEEQREIYREKLNIETKKINNYSPKEVIEHINKKSSLLNGLSFMELIEQAIKLHPLGKDFGLHNRIAAVFELLDMFGYWKDKQNDKSNYARLWDSSHTFFSAYCDYFISNDKRTRNKAKVVFDIFDINTNIVSSKGIA